MKRSAPRTTSSLVSESGTAFLVLVFLMVFAGWAVAAVFTLATPSQRMQAEDLTEKRAQFLKAAIARYRTYSSGAGWPSSLASLLSDVDGEGACVVGNDPGAPATFKVMSGWCGPYLDVMFSGDSQSYKVDGFGTEFVYDSGTQTLKTCGPNRQCGGGYSADDRTFAL